MAAVAPRPSIQNSMDRPLRPSRANILNSSLTMTGNKTTITSDTTITTTTTTPATTSTSCPEFRNGYRLQRRAYERRRSQTPTLETIITNRRPKNEYVDRLKEFYSTGPGVPENGHSRGSDFSAGDNHKAVSISGKHHVVLPNHETHPPDVKSILRLPDTRQPRAGKPNSVKISLPAETTSANANTVMLRAPASGSHVSNKIPPPVPLQVFNAQSRQNETESYLSSSLTSNLASSILNAVNELRKTSMSGKSSRSYQQQQQQQQRQRRSRNANNGNYKSGKTDSKNLAMKMTLPCRIGCCYCVYSSILGPVKVFMTRSQTPKQGPWLAGIRDGHGRLVIPASRKGDVLGLVYDAHSHSLHPPAKGQRPLYPSAKVGHQSEKVGVMDKKGTKSKRKVVKRHS